MPIAALPLYDFPELREETDLFWEATAESLNSKGLSAPRRLTRDLPFPEILGSPDLLLAQVCGIDVVKHYRGKVELVVTPRYSAPGCSGPTYRSFVVVRHDSEIKDLEDLRGKVCTVNGFDSHSGMNALRSLVAPLSREGRFFGDISVSGGHAASLALVGEGKADVAAIDCITHALLSNCRPQLIEGTRVIAETAPAPAPPLVTRVDADQGMIKTLRDILRLVIADPGLAAVRMGLMISDFDVVALKHYERIVEADEAAHRLGYTEFESVLKRSRVS